ncbi:PE-PPE domain-containing protein [Mycobacterium sp. EPG1]|nr:PE-PPE domain-containing protein [Mycobacterium sp. EPG1]
MRFTTRGVREAGIACGAAAASVALAVSTAASGWAASTALVVGGLGTPSLHEVVMSQLLGGALQDYDQRVSVNWPAEASQTRTLGQSIEIGRANLNAQIDQALARLERGADGNLLDGEQVTVVGLSAGSLVVTETLRGWQNDGEADPAADEINFVVVADSSRQEIIDDTETYNPQYDYTYRRPPDTVYDTVEVTGEYDGMADFPDRFNLTAISNAITGSVLRHVQTMFSDLSDVPKQNTTVTENAVGGTTVRYLVPAETLPLVQANPRLAPREAELRAQVDRAYSRNDPANVAARLAGPDVPQRIRDIVTREADDQDPVGVNLGLTAAAQQQAETEAGAGPEMDGQRSLGEQIAATERTVDGASRGVAMPSSSTVGAALDAAADKLSGADDEDGATQTSKKPTRDRDMARASRTNTTSDESDKSDKSAK